MADSPEFADIRERQKLYLYLIAILLGMSAMLGFGIALVFKGRVLIPVTDFASSVLLLLTYLYLRATKKLYNACVMAALCFMGFLLVHLISGGTDSSGPIWYFVFPPLAFYLLGLRMGLLFSLMVAVPAMMILLALVYGVEVAGYTTTFILRFLISYLIETFLVYIMESQRIKAQQRVKILSGLLPICANCKKIRDDKGYWNQIESYLVKHSAAELSHGICPECAKKLYPDLDVYGGERSSM